MAAESLTVIDNRTGKKYDIPVEHGTINAMDLRQIKASDGDFGLMSYDPAFTNIQTGRYVTARKRCMAGVIGFERRIFRNPRKVTKL
jgi:hypothetical protein